MEKHKILVNSSIVTQDWKKYVGGGVKLVVASLVGALGMLLTLPLWFITLGHVNFVGVINDWVNKEFGEPQI